MQRLQRLWKGLARVVVSGEATRDVRRVTVVCLEMAKVVVAGGGGSEWLCEREVRQGGDDAVASRVTGLGA